MSTERGLLRAMHVTPLYLRRLTWALPYALAILVASGQFLFAYKSRFIPANNDVLGILVLADGVDFTKPSSLYNMFYPFLYPLLVHGLPEGDRVAWLGLGSWILNSITLVLVVAIARRLTSSTFAALVSILVLAFLPLSLRYFTTAGPDSLATALLVTSVAFTVLPQSGESAPRRQLAPYFALTAGLCAGLAVVTRQHVLPLALGALFIVTWKASRRVWLPAVCAFAVPVAFQALLSIFAGRLPLASSAAFEIYQQVEPFDWYTSGEIDPASYSSIPAILSAHQAQFIHEWATNLGVFVIALAVMGAAAVLSRTEVEKRVQQAMFIAGMIYAFLICLGWSARSELAIAPFLAIASASVAAALLRQVPKARRTVAGTVAVTLGLIIALSWSLPQGTLELYGRIGQEKSRAVIEASLDREAPVDHASQILSDDYELFLRNIPGNVPYTPGGWLAIGANGNEKRIQLDFESVDSLLCSANQAGLRASAWLGGRHPLATGEVERMLQEGYKPFQDRATTIRSLHDVGPSATCVASARPAQ